MVLPLRRPRPQPVPAPASAPVRQRYLLVVAVCTLLSLALLVPPVAYRAGYEAGVRAADEDAVYRAVGDAMRLGVRVALRSDSLTRGQRVVARQAIQRLPQPLQDSVRVRDSLRALRWSTP